MAVLAVSPTEASAAIAVDGRLIAAATDPPVSGLDAADSGPEEPCERAIAVCLLRAGLAPQDVSTLAVVDSGNDGRGVRSHPSVLVHRSSLAPDTTRHVSRAQAQMAQVAAVSGETAALLVVDDGDVPLHAVVARKCGGKITPPEPRPDIQRVAALGRRLASLLGVAAGPAPKALDVVGAGGSREYLDAFRQVIATGSDGLLIDEARFDRVVAAARTACPGDLHDAKSLHRLVQEQRAALAGSFRDRLVEVFADALSRLCDASRLESVGVAGNFFASPSFNSALRIRLGRRLSIAPAPETWGLALGAALAAGDVPVEPIRHLALGRVFGEQEIKRVLENCRLEYLYEPDWTRLMSRVSTLLAGRKIVGWFQEPMDFGPRSFGSRSILCDPSDRWARDNINAYLLQRRADEPLGISLASDRASECLVEGAPSPFMLFDAEVRATSRSRLISAIDRQDRCAVHTVDESGSPELLQLLQTHYARTGVPALINVGLCAVPGRLAESPRDAIRAAFGSATDVLVMGRFVVVKDSSLLRSGGGAMPAKSN